MALILRYFTLLIVVLVATSLPLKAIEDENVLNLYIWQGMVPPEIIAKFEKETGVKVIVDFFDSNEVLEAKLLLGRSGYDLVFPSAWPYLARQVPAELYQKLDKKKLQNYKKIDPIAFQRLDEADPGNLYAIPITWGLIGFGYNEDLVKEIMPDAPVDSWAMFFDPNVIRKFNSCGVTMLDEAVDVFVPALLYLKLDASTASKEDIDKAVTLLQSVRPYIDRFDVARSPSELASGDMCLVQHWISNLYIAYNDVPKNQRSNIKFVIPKEGAGMWIDVAAIPADAPHADNAHKFLDFILRPENIAATSNKNFFGNFVPESKQFMDKSLVNNKLIFPDKKDMKKFVLTTAKAPKFQRMMTRAMTKVRTGT